MAKKKFGDAPSQAKIRVFFAEFEGDNATIQEGMRAFSAAVGRISQAPAKPRISNGATNGQLPLEDIEDVAEDQENVEEPDEPSVEVVSPPRQKRKPPTMSLVKEMDLRPKGAESFIDFWDSKHPVSQPQALTVAVYYMKKVLSLAPVTPNHVYTCLKEVRYRVPNDLPQIIRNCATREGWVDTKNINDLQITTRGENFVEHDLPKAAKK